MQLLGKHKLSPARITFGFVIWGLTCVMSSRVRDVGLHSAVSVDRVSPDLIVYKLPLQLAALAIKALRLPVQPM